MGACEHGISLYEDWCSQCKGAPGSKSGLVKAFATENNIPYVDLPLAEVSRDAVLPTNKVLHSHDETKCHHGNPSSDRCEFCDNEQERLEQQEWNDMDIESFGDQE